MRFYVKHLWSACIARGNLFRLSTIDVDTWTDLSRTESICNSYSRWFFTNPHKMQLSLVRVHFHTVRNQSGPCKSPNGVWWPWQTSIVCKSSMSLGSVFVIFWDRRFRLSWCQGKWGGGGGIVIDWLRKMSACDFDRHLEKLLLSKKLNYPCILAKRFAIQCPIEACKNFHNDIIITFHFCLCGIVKFLFISPSRLLTALSLIVLVSSSEGTKNTGSASSA